MPLRKKKLLSLSWKKELLDWLIPLVSSLPWTLVTPEELSFLKTWKLFSDLVQWLPPIYNLLLKICLCLKVSKCQECFLNNSLLFICYQENFWVKLNITIGVFVLLNQSLDKLVDSRELILKLLKIHYLWELLEISTLLKSLLMINLFSLVLLEICSLDLNVNNKLIWNLKN